MDEVSEPVSRTRTIAGAVLAPAAFLALWIAPLDLPQPAHRVAAIFAAVVIAWVTEVIPIAITALLIGPALVATGVTDAKSAFAPYADPLLFLFVGGFMIARAMSRHGLDRRLALFLVTRSTVDGRPGRVRIALAGGAFLLSMWISNTATAAIVVPILLGLGAEAAKRDETSSSTRTVLGGLLAVAYACSLGGLGTPVGSPPNLITMRLLREAGISLGFLDWMKIGLPVGAIGLAIMLFQLSRTHPADTGRIDVAAARTETQRPWTRGEVVTFVAFLVAVVGWTIPGVLEVIGVPLGWGAAVLNDSVVALVAASLLYMVPASPGGPRVLPVADGLRIDWGVILLFGGGISLGKQLFATGLSLDIGRGFVHLTGVHELWTLTAVAAFFSIFFTEVCSNTATATMVVPLVIGVARELQVSPAPPVLAVGLAASCAFMLPIATGPNAIVYGTGRVPSTTMFREGLVLNVLCVVLIVVLLRVLCPLYGWA